MQQMYFRKWLLKEWDDIFGFDKEITPLQKNDNSDKPLNAFDIEEMMNYLNQNKLGEKRPFLKFMNELHWGEGTGAIRVSVNTRLNVIIERQGIDLHGDPRWFTCRVYQLDRNGEGGKEIQVSNEILEIANNINTKPMPSPAGGYDDLERLVYAMASSIKRTASSLFIFEGIKKIDNYNYIIALGLRGSGVEAPHQSKVLQNQTHINYSEHSGIIRVFNYNIEAHTGRDSKWKIMETDVNWYFAPTQSRDEIIETMATSLRWY